MQNIRQARSNSFHSALRCAPIALLPLSLFFVTGCNRQPAPDVVATVNGQPIMRAELDRTAKNNAGENQSPTPEQSTGIRLGVLHDLIDYEILQQRAAKLNLTATSEEVDAKVAEMKAPFSEEQFQQHLHDSNLTLDNLKRDIRRNITTDKLLNKEINSKISVTDADVTNYFNQHKSEFNLIEAQYHLAQIIVTSLPAQQPGNLQASKATSDADAKKKILALKNRLDSGEDFGSLAMSFSENPQTSPNGGDMGFVSDSQLRTDPTVYAVVSKLKNGERTDILPIPGNNPNSKGTLGYAIFRLISREPAGQRNLSDPAVQQAIREQLHNGRAQLIKNAYFEMLRDDAKVRNFYAEQVFKNEAH